jgi:hypothetical protein
MERARFTEEQIIGVLRDHKAGAKSRSAAKHGVRSDAVSFEGGAHRNGPLDHSQYPSCEESRSFVTLDFKGRHFSR